MKVYLDNNIIVGIENGEFDIALFRTIGNVEYFYSAAHIDELIEGEHLQKLSVEKRLMTIEQLAGTNHILNGAHTPEFFPKTPKEMYEISHTPWAMMLRTNMNIGLNAFNPDRDKFLEVLKLNKIEVNNIKPCEIINEIDKRLQKADDPNDRISVEQYLERTEAIGRAVYGTLFNLLDFACFHKDKPTDHSNIARMHDASHAYFAQLCDVFVSNDKKMRYKTEAVYNYLGVDTRVMSGKEYITNFQNR